MTLYLHDLSNTTLSFADIGGSLAPCEDVFAGTGPFSVPESRYLGDFLRSHGNRIKLYLTLHSFGQYFLYPWGYSAHEYALDADDLVRGLSDLINVEARCYKHILKQSGLSI